MPTLPGTDEASSVLRMQRGNVRVGVPTPAPREAQAAQAARDPVLAVDPDKKTDVRLVNREFLPMFEKRSRWPQPRKMTLCLTNEFSSPEY